MSNVKSKDIDKNEFSFFSSKIKKKKKKKPVTVEITCGVIYWEFFSIVGGVSFIQMSQ